MVLRASDTKKSHLDAQFLSVTRNGEYEVAPIFISATIVTYRYPTFSLND